MKSPRAYSMVRRGAQATTTRERILEVSRALLDDPAIDLTLERVAQDAHVTVQTILRNFNSKRGLLVEAIGSLRSGDRGVARPSPTVADNVTLLFDDYEEIGDRVIRMLADEHRIPEFAEGARHGRRSHRRWVTASFADFMKDLDAGRRRRVMHQLLVATDVYSWKLLRRDFRLTRREAETTMVRLIEGALHNE
jgi:AcrR family transcriptional regulator